MPLELLVYETHPRKSKPRHLCTQRTLLPRLGELVNKGVAPDALDNRRFAFELTGTFQTLTIV
jgi:hypothetical protein